MIPCDRVSKKGFGVNGTSIRGLPSINLKTAPVSPVPKRTFDINKQQVLSKTTPLVSCFFFLKKGFHFLKAEYLGYNQDCKDGMKEEKCTVNECLESLSISLQGRENSPVKSIDS